MTAKASWLDRDLARDHANRFLACFSPDTRYFTSNGLQTFTVTLDRRIAGIC